ncbi:MAG: hypothetical protein K2J20_00480, partial [Bacilli bacterium]|nr:hypothetical protein [Bacilli bacterium]
SDIAYISKITPNNNRVVCYEFIYIFAKLLEGLGLNFAINHRFIDEYGKDHCDLRLRCGKFLLEADAVQSVFNGDIAVAKLNYELLGLQCINNSAETRKEFQKAVNKVYQAVALEQAKKEIISYETRNDILKEYGLAIDVIPSIDERCQILFDKIRRAGVLGMDALAYMLKLKNVLFTVTEQDENFKVVIVRNNAPLAEGIEAEPLVIVSINSENLNEGYLHNRYFICDEYFSLIPIEKGILESMFQDKLLEYIKITDDRVPGINDGYRQLV